MSEPQRPSDELAGLILAGVDLAVRMVRATVRAAVILLIALVVIGAPFFLWGLVHGWN